MDFSSFLRDLADHCETQAYEGEICPDIDVDRWLRIRRIALDGLGRLSCDERSGRVPEMVGGIPF